jgi:hypothetical protein
MRTRTVRVRLTTTPVTRGWVGPTIRAFLTGCTLVVAVVAARDTGMAPAGAVVVPVVATDGGTRVPCLTDEPHPGPDPRGCVWDARHMGNGVGRSFVVRPSGRLVYVTHERAHYLLTGVTL